MTAPGIASVLGDTIAAELGDTARFPSAKQLCGYTGRCPRVDQSGGRDQRGPLAKNGPPYLRWALIEAAITPPTTPATATTTSAQAAAWSATRRQGRPGGGCPQAHEAIWSMLTQQPPFAPARPLPALWSPDDPCLNWAPAGASHRPAPPTQEAIDR